MGRRGPPQRVITDSQRKRLRAAETRIETARLAWARMVREFGIGAVARDQGLTPSSLAERIRAIEAKAAGD